MNNSNREERCRSNDRYVLYVSTLRDRLNLGFFRFSTIISVLVFRRSAGTCSDAGTPARSFIYPRAVGKSCLPGPDIVGTIDSHGHHVRPSPVDRSIRHRLTERIHFPCLFYSAHLSATGCREAPAAKDHGVADSQDQGQEPGGGARWR